MIDPHELSQFVIVCKRNNNGALANSCSAIGQPQSEADRTKFLTVGSVERTMFLRCINDLYPHSLD